MTQFARAFYSEHGSMGSILSMQWPVSGRKRTGQLPDALLVLEGAVHQMRGRIAVLRGTLLHNDIMRARGHRQQLVGMLQRFWKRDRQSVEAWVDSLLRRTVAPPPVMRRAWRPGRASILHQET
jgi:uncharacterized protein YjbJ (UPF0337 family)